MGIFQQEEFRAVCNRAPYRTLRDNILQYYREEAVTELENALTKVESCNVFQYKALMTYKLSILKLVEGKEHIDRSRDIYLRLYEQLYDNGLHLDAVRVLVTLLDECTSPYNVLIQHPLWSAPMYYSDFLEQAPHVPDPVLEPDGIHLRYFQLALPPLAIFPLHADVMVQHIDTVIAEFRSWKSHPFKVELSIEIAHLLMRLNRKEDAREFHRFFKESGVSEMQMASWVRADVKALELEFGN